MSQTVQKSVTRRRQWEHHRPLSTHTQSVVCNVPFDRRRRTGSRFSGMRLRRSNGKLHTMTVMQLDVLVILLIQFFIIIIIFHIIFIFNFIFFFFVVFIFVVVKLTNQMQRRHISSVSAFTTRTWSVTRAQGVYKFNRTNFQEIPGGISRKIQDMFALLRAGMLTPEKTGRPVS